MKPVVTILKGEPPTLREAQALVDGYVERLVVADGILLVNEDGRLKHLPINETASAIAGQTIVGNVVLLSKKIQRARRSRCSRPRSSRCSNPRRSSTS